MVRSFAFLVFHQRCGRLSGSVDTAQDEQLAADIARQYVPNLPVVNTIAVENRTTPPQP